MNSEDDDDSIIYEPDPIVTELTGNESEPDALSFARVCWLLRRYSSRPYIARAQLLFRGVCDAFEAWPDAAEQWSPETLRRWGRSLREQQAAFERGLAALDRGRSAAAHAAILEAVSGIEPADARDDLHFSLRLLLDGLGPAATVGGARAGAMALRIRHTFAGGWCYERILADRPSLHLLPRHWPEPLPAVSLPAAAAPVVKTGRKVPLTGIWMPVTIRLGCPNFLVAGTPAPLMTRACERIDYEALPAWDPPTPAWSDYEFTEEETVWRLVREGGAADDEPGLLDEDNALPD